MHAGTGHDVVSGGRGDDKLVGIDGGDRLFGEVGRDLHDRLAKYAEHFAKVGRGLGSATAAYNEAVGSLERRVLPKARELKKLGAASGGSEIETPPQIDLAPRPLLDESARA